MISTWGRIPICPTIKTFVLFFPNDFSVSLNTPAKSSLPRRRFGIVNASTTEEKIRIEVDMKETKSEKEKVLRVGLVCGGPSAERGISLNSARSVLDHIKGDDLHVSCYYIDNNLKAYAISPAQVYSNTPADFDFRLESLAQGFSSLSNFADHLAVSVDIVFPVIHGRFGEDGGIQELLEKSNIPFVGTRSNECRKAFDKYLASLELHRHGFVTVPGFLIQGNEADETELSKWFTKNQLHFDTGKVVVKPCVAGSSIGVTVAYGVTDALKKANEIISEGIDNKVLVEIFLEGGCEFTAIVLDVGSGNNCHPIVLLPTEVELQSHGNLDNGEKDAIFNYRRKYLPTQQVVYHTPPRFPMEIIENIRHGASLVFQKLGLRDFARIDGWFLPPNSHTSSLQGNKFGKSDLGTVIFTDINLISGMEQTSFLFQQASKVGFSHSNILRTIIQRACLRFPSLLSNNIISRRSNTLSLSKHQNKRKVFVLFGGDSSERQVSLMSGTNVWLNLQTCDDLEVIPCLLATTDMNTWTVWTLPYSLVLRHTMEEVLDACIESIKPDRAVFTSRLREIVMKELTQGLGKHNWFRGFDISDELPNRLFMKEWIELAKQVDATVFIAVHGSIGEDGTLQSLLDAEEIPYTGPGIVASKTCMDKVATSQALKHLEERGVLTIDKEVCKTKDLLRMSISDIWQELTLKLKCKTLCVKPARDGCSTGVARLCCHEDLSVYVKALENFLARIPPNSLSKPHGNIEMPNPPPEQVIFEPFIETDDIIVSSKSRNMISPNLLWEGSSRWVEVTVGVIGKRGLMRSLTPSITVKESGGILSLEEKFQGGTGINLTPPPLSIISNEALKKCKQHIELIANTLKLEGFSRIDAFVNVDSGEVLIIEVNTVPGMTPSTVLIHQALAEQPPMYPHNFFRMLLDLGFESYKPSSLLTKTLHHRYYSATAAAALEPHPSELITPLYTYLDGYPKPDPKHDEIFRAIPRAASGTNISNKLRKAGHIPSIVFEQEDGQHGGNKRLISVHSNQVKKLVTALGRSFFLSRVFDLEVRSDFESGDLIEKVRVLPRSLHLHAGTDAPLNVTFIRAPSDALLKVDVPLVFRGDDISPGLKKGAYLNIIKRTVKYLCPADIVPPFIDVDLSEMDVGQKLVMGDLKVHPALKLLRPKDEAVIKIMGGRASST